MMMGDQGRIVAELAGGIDDSQAGISEVG